MLNAWKKRIIPNLMLLSALVLVIVVPFLYGQQFPLSVHSVFEDVVTYGKLAPFVGFMSDMGIVLWFATAILFAHGYHRILSHTSIVTVSEAGFYIVGIVLFVLLGLDDRLLIHEYLTDRYGIAEGLIVGIYGLMFGAWGVVYQNFLLKKGYCWLVVMVLAFSLSVAVDLGLMHSILAGWSVGDLVVVEESAKWVGIVAIFVHVFYVMEEPPLDA